MLLYLRHFFGVSIILIIIAMIIVSYSFNKAANNVIAKQAEQNNVALVKGFYNSVWKKDPQLKTLFYTIPPNQQLEYREFIDFSKNTLFFLQDLPVVKFNIYSPQGKRIFSTDQKNIYISNAGVEKSPIKGDSRNDITPQAVASDGKPSSYLIKNTEFLTPSGVIKKGSVVRTLVPLLPDDYVEILGYNQSNVEAIVEVYLDTTDYSNDLFFYQALSTAFIIISFTSMYIGFFISSLKAERIIERQHETYVELETAKARAETENKQKSQFLASISHELRTPLNAIIGFSEIIKDEVMGELQNEQYKAYIRDIHGSGVHLLSLINDILDYSKAEAGKLELEFEEVDLNKIIVSSLRLQEPRAQSAEVKLEKELPPERISIVTDSKRLKQILLNLLSNAVKFTPSGGTVKISAWLNLKDSTVSVEVRDTGIGIAPKDLARALAPFGQVDNQLARKYEGTGLGLPLTKKFVELIGGKMNVESEVNKGTSITINIPIKPKTAADSGSTTPQRSKASALTADF